MAGVILVIMGLTGTGTAVRFIPRPVVTGFTGGIAVTIASTQLQDFFGITLPGPAPGDFVGRIRTLIEHADTASAPTMALGASVVVLVVVWNRTPVAGIVHAVTLLIILLNAAPLAGLVPMAVLAGILLVVSFNMGEWHEVPALWKQRWADPLVWLATFTLTILADLTVAVEVGMILAALLFISRVAATTPITAGRTSSRTSRSRPT
jgi:MFS superfamily sulfate permease-like transporter